MNLRMVFNTIGRVLRIEAALFLLPIAVSLCYHEYDSAICFAVTVAISFALGMILVMVFKPKDHVIYAREGFAIVALVWLCVSAMGALPFTISGEIPSYVDAFFETVSGFTTTGSSILTDVESLSKGMLFWRSFTHWIGGMGFIVFVIAIVPNVSDRSIHILRAEVPGPVVGKLVPRLKDTAKILYLIYFALTVILILMLWAGDMSFYESMVHAFGTAGTGGFAIKADGLASYSSYSKWVITIFMLIFGTNFNIYYLLLIRKFKSALKSSEFWFYISIVVISTAIITLNILSRYKTFSEALCDSAFQVSSIITTTGYSTTDFNIWPELSKSILFVLMIPGACAGSTAGGLKMSRVIMLLKQIKRDVNRMIHPRSVTAVKFEGKTVDEATLNGVSVYFAAYFACIIVLFLLICFESFGFETNFTAVVSCFNNIGPGFGAVGPVSSFAAYSDFSKIVLSVAMLLGRLEIFPLLIALSPSSWIKK